MLGLVSAPQNQTLLFRLQTILLQHSPRKKSILEEALMPISPPTSASTEQNACTSPLQQLFNNLNNRPRLGSAHHSMVPTLLSTNLLHLRFLLLLRSPSTHIRCRESHSAGFVRRHCRKHRKSLTADEVDWRKVGKTGGKNYIIHLKTRWASNNVWYISITDVKLIFSCKTKHKSPVYRHSSLLSLLSVHLFVSQPVCQRSWTRQLSNLSSVSEDGRWSPVFLSSFLLSGFKTTPCPPTGSSLKFWDVILSQQKCVKEQVSGLRSDWLVLLPRSGGPFMVADPCRAPDGIYIPCLCVDASHMLHFLSLLT